MIPPFPKKYLGQNFLVDKNIINKIVRLGNLNKNSIVIEIGPGTGNLTRVIYEEKPKIFLGIEKDKKLFHLLKINFLVKENMSFLNDDALFINESKLINTKEKVIIFGNLPYKISTQLLIKWITLASWPPFYKKLILMFQKEVADRIVANHGSKDYGRLSILTNWRLKVKKHFDVSKNCFFPRPKVDSSVLVFEPIIKGKYLSINPKNLEKITRVIFSNRRKMINKAISKLFKDKINYKDLGLDLNLRPEQLTNEDYLNLTKKYEDLFYKI